MNSGRIFFFPVVLFSTSAGVYRTADTFGVLFTLGRAFLTLFFFSFSFWVWLYGPRRLPRNDHSFGIKY